MPNNSRYLCLIILFWGAASASASAVELRSDDAAMAVAYLVSLLKRYPDQDAAGEMAAAIERKLENGGYRDVDSRSTLAKALTADLRSVRRDLHLGVQYSPTASTADAAHHLNRPEVLQRLRRENFGFCEARILEGNVGYLRISALHDLSVAAETARHALGLLKHTNALIIDVRNNLGGEPGMVRFLLSAFLGKPTHLNTLHYTDARDDPIEEIWSDPALHDGSLIGVPLYILTNRYVASGAEDFAYSAQAIGRATIVGTATIGAAHLGESHYREDLQLNFSMPHGYVINAVTGTDWEGTGVMPDYEAGEREALKVAQNLAWERLGYTVDADAGDRRRQTH